MNTRQGLFPDGLLFSLLICLLLCCVCGSALAADAAVAARYKQLQNKVSKKGKIRVIVGVQTLYKPEGRLARSSEVMRQRLGISNVQARVAARMKQFPSKIIRQFNYIPYMALEVDRAGLDDLMQNPDVFDVHEDIAVPPVLSESVPLVGANAVWSTGFTGLGQTLAVLDTGVDTTHPAFLGKIDAMACFSTNSSNVSSFCPNGQTSQIGAGAAAPCNISGCDHGTHVAGIAASSNQTFTGVAKDAHLIPVQIFSRVNNPAQCDPRPAPARWPFSATSNLG